MASSPPHPPTHQRQCRSKFTTPSLYISRAANMKSNEPKSSAAAACPASARNTGGKERKGEREQDEGGREGEREQDESDTVQG